MKTEDEKTFSDTMLGDEYDDVDETTLEAASEDTETTPDVETTPDPTETEQSEDQDGGEVEEETTPEDVATLEAERLEAERTERQRNQYITQLQQRNAELERHYQAQRTQPEPVDIDGDAMLEDPRGSLEKLGFVDRRYVDAAIRAEMANREATDFIARTPDWVELEPVMDQLLYEMPSLKNLPKNEGVKVLLSMARDRTKGAAPKPETVQPSNKAKTDRAKTSGGTPAPRTRGSGAPGGYASMSTEQLEKELGFSDE